MKKQFLPAFAALFLMTSLMACGGAEDETTTENQGETSTTDEVVPEEIEIDINLVKVEEVPEACVFEYNMVDAYTWSDKNGKNYFIRTISEIDETQDEYGPTASQYLYAYHWTENAKGEYTLLREVTDFVKDCEFDIMVSHEMDGLALTDLDEDQIGEIAFIYRLTCTSDVSPSSQKLILLEDGQKYALRGQTEVMGMGGEYEVGPEFEGSPSGFLSHCEALWNDNKAEYDFEL